MLPYNTLQILKNLSKEEIKKLGDFIKSPYFNSKDVLFQLYKETVKHYPHFEPEKFDYKKIYKKIYSDRIYKEKTIKNLYSDFGVLLKKFVAYERLSYGEREYDLALAKGLQDRKCYELSIKVIEEAKKKSSKAPFHKEEYFYDMSALDSLHYDNLLGMNKINLDYNHGLLNSINDNLTIFYLKILFFTAKEDSILTKFHSIKNDISSVNKVFIENFNADNFFKQINEKDITPETKITYYMYKYCEDDVSEIEFRNYEKLIMTYIENFSNEFKICCWGSLIEIIILHLIPKDKAYYRDVFRINDYFIKLNLYKKNKIGTMFPISMFRNISAVALVLKEYSWLEDFINSNSVYLEEEARENEINYSMGRLSFQVKKYEKSLEYFNKVKFQQISEKLHIKFYYLMNYIELKSYSAALSMLGSIKHLYLNSKEMSETLTLHTENSLKFFRELIRAEEQNKKIDYAILQEAKNAGRYYQKPYIISKLENLK